MVLSETDRDLINRCLQDEQIAWQILIEKYLPVVYNFTYYFSGQTVDPADVAQEVFIKVWKNLRKFNPDKNFKSWLLTIAKNTTIDHLRRRREINFSQLWPENETGEFQTTAEESIPDQELLPDQLAQLRDDQELLARVLEQLSPELRLVIILHYQNDWSLVEIAQWLDKPANTIKSQHHRALAKMRHWLSLHPND